MRKRRTVVHLQEQTSNAVKCGHYMPTYSTTDALSTSCVSCIRTLPVAHRREIRREQRGND